VDIDGVTNLDVVDIDGAVDMASTLAVTGIATFIDDIIIGDGKTIGSTSDIDAITIASNGQVTLTQTLIGTALDISGNIDVDGVTNLDVVDIDGAVDMASTLDVAGAVTISSADNSTQLTLVSTDADALEGPVLKLFRNSSSPAANDILGMLDFSGENSEDTEKSFFRIRAQAVDVTAGSEDAEIYFQSIVAGSIATKMTFSSAKVEIDDALDVTGVTTFTAIPVANAGLSVKNGSTTAGFVSFFEDSSNGNNSVKLIGPAATADVTLTLPAAAGTIATTDDATALAIALG